MSQSHRFKGETADEVFQVQCFWWERGASVGAEFDLFNFQDLYMHKNINKTGKGKKTKTL